MRRAWRWWILAETTCARLAAPPADVAGVDRAVEALVRGSRLWTRGASLAGRVHAAWLDSWCRRLGMRVRAREAYRVLRGG
jgi:hypothetical protein